MSLRITELDFDQIKTNLKDYLRSQDEFNSYDFEASGLSVLIELLAYNTHYNAYLANQQHNENFLDSAVKRESVVSKAKQLSYTPRSGTASTAVVDFEVTSYPDSPSFLTLGKYTTFSSDIDGTDYTFVNTETMTAARQGASWKFNGLVLREGRPYSYSYNVVNPGPSEKYVIPNDGVDTSTLTVTVLNSSTDTTATVFTKIDDITSVTGSSNIYYIEENLQGKYEIFFGDGTLGKKLTAGNIVLIEYIITHGAAANVSQNYNQTFVPTGTVSGTVSVIQNSTGGAAKETIDQIKFNAPRSYIAQSRVVTPDDYLAVLSQKVANIDSVNVWGGEENDPPIYGKVFISMKPSYGYQITNTQKETIKREILKKRNVVSVIPEFVDPDYVYVNLQVNVKYRANDTTKSSSDIQNAVTSSISSYFLNELQKFNSSYVVSRLTKAIDGADPSIYGSNVSTSIQKRIYPALNSSLSYNIKFSSRIHPTGIFSTRFYVSNIGVQTAVSIVDSPDTTPPDYNGTGTLYLQDVISGTNIREIGSVNYSTGEMTITQLSVTGFIQDQNEIRINAEQQESTQDINISNNQILVLDDSTSNLILNRVAGVTTNIIAI